MHIAAPYVNYFRLQIQIIVIIVFEIAIDTMYRVKFRVSEHFFNENFSPLFFGVKIVQIQDG